MHFKKPNFILFLLIIGINANSQIPYFFKVETGYLKYKTNIIQVDPGPNWKGYNLYEENGIDFNVVNGIKYKNKLFAGLGLGYLNFEGINGFSLFSDIEYLPLKTKLSPLLNTKIGYSHIWNQYENGKGTALIELTFGLNYRFKKEFSIYTKSGFLFTQQSFLIPIRLGFKF